jgi:hypothetical protein
MKISEIKRLESQLSRIESASTDNEVAKLKEIKVVQSRIASLESELSSKIAEVQTLEKKLSSKIAEVHALEAELSSKTMELHSRESECEKYKHLANMPIQSPVSNHQNLSSLNMSKNETKLGGSLQNTERLSSQSNNYDKPTQVSSCGLMAFLIISIIAIIWFSFKKHLSTPMAVKPPLISKKNITTTLEMNRSKMNLLMLKKVQRRNGSVSYPRSTRKYSYIPRRW